VTAGRTNAAPQGGGWTDRQGRPGRFGVVFAAVWLVFLVYGFRDAWALLPGVRGWLGLVSLAGFVAVYLGSFAGIRRRRQLGVMRGEPRAAAAILGALVGLGILATLAVGQEGTSTAVYVAVVAVLCLPGPAAPAGHQPG